MCDYFISMFDDLGVQDASSKFKNLMLGYNSQSQEFTNSLASTVDATNGLSFSSGQTQTITGVSVTSQRAIGVQFWFKGTFTNSAQLAAIAKSASVKSAYIDRTSNDINVKSTHSGLSVTLSNAVTSMDSTGWIFIGFSVGWMARSNDFMM